MLIIQLLNLQNERKTFSRKIHESYKYWKVVKIVAYGCKHTGFFHGFWEILWKRNKEIGICYNNFALWKIETIVAAKRQKQPFRGVLQVFVELLPKLKGILLNSCFFSFRIFHWYLITNLMLLKYLSFDFFISASL